MKSLLTILTPLLIFSVVASAGPGGGGVGNIVRLSGGGGVGNMITAAIPKTSVILDYPNTWKSNTTADMLTIDNTQDSNLKAARVEINSTTEPTLIDVKAAALKRYPNRSYKDISVNGLKGIRFDEDKIDHINSDLYLLASEHDVIRVQAILKKSDASTKTGETILSTLRIKYEGKAVTDQEHHITMSEEDVYYSLANDCFEYTTCKPSVHDRGSPIYLRGNTLQVGGTGYDGGKILDLGEVSYNDIRLNGEYLEVPKSNVALDEIYKTLSPRSPMLDLERVELQLRHTYLIRTISWPEDDTVTKFRVDDYVNHKFVITYQKLAQVPKTELKANVDRMNEYTKKVEMPRDSGIVTLYSRGHWGDYHSSTFNFTYATRDNYYIANNRKHLFYDETNGPVFSGNGLGGVRDIGTTKAFEDLTSADFPNPNAWARRYGYRNSADAIKDHVYIVQSFDDDVFVYAAVKVLDIASDKRWIRIAWRRIKITKPYQFQDWLQAATDPSTKSGMADLKQINGQNFAEFKFADGFKSAVESYGYEKKMTFSANNGPGYRSYVEVDNRYFSQDKTSGLAHAPKGLKLENVTIADFNKAYGTYEGYSDLKVGQLYLAKLENLYELNMVAIEITSVTKAGISFRYRHLYSAQIRPAD